MRALPLLFALLLATSCARPATSAYVSERPEQVLDARIGVLEARQAQQQQAVDARLDQLTHDIHALRTALVPRATTRRAK